MAITFDSKRPLLSLFCGPGGLDLGFEQAGFSVGLAYDLNSSSIASYNHNRAAPPHGRVHDVRLLCPEVLDGHWGGVFRPGGVIGGPPCQSFSKANHFKSDDDPRHELLQAFAKVIIDLNARSAVPFFVFENVPELDSAWSSKWLGDVVDTLSEAGFEVHRKVLTASDYGVPQNRDRLFTVGFNRAVMQESGWTWPKRSTANSPRTVRDAIWGLPEPQHFERDLDPSDFAHHPNHWCMAPKSRKFQVAGALSPGRSSQRSFKTLDWDKPSLTVAYGNREVHIHPKCHRRLSVFEAMKLQGFPDKYVLLGTLSSQINQVSEAVPPPMSKAIAVGIKAMLAAKAKARKSSRSTLDIPKGSRRESRLVPAR